MFDLFLALAAIISGGIASIAGFGIGSILTPLLAVRLGTKLAVGVVSFPHFFATILRFLLIREPLDRRVLVTFGIASAAGGLVGALLHTRFNSAILGYILAPLLVFAGVMGLSGLASRMRFGRITGYMAGALSGLFGGLVGNQGGIRSAALMGFDINKEAFVATATAIGLVVDVFSHAGIRGGAVGRYLCAMEALVDRFGRSGRWYACGEASTEKQSRSRV